MGRDSVPVGVGVCCLGTLVRGGLHLGNKLRELALPMFRPRCTSADLAQMVDVDCIKFLLVLFY